MCRRSVVAEVGRFRFSEKRRNGLRRVSFFYDRFERCFLLPFVAGGFRAVVCGRRAFERNVRKGKYEVAVGGCFDCLRIIEIQWR